MDSEKYSVIFFGRIFPGQDPAQVRARVGEMFRISGPQLETLFSGARIAVKKDLDLATAQRYRDAFQKAGALVELRKFEPAAPDAEPPPPARADSAVAPQADAQPASGQTPSALNADLLPPRTGSLEEFSRAETPAAIPDISHLDMDAVGADLDPTRRQTPPLELDLSGLDLDRTGADLDPDYRPPPPLQVDTSGLSMTPAKTGSLEDCAKPEPPARLPDISSLSLEPSDDSTGKR